MHIRVETCVCSGMGRKDMGMHELASFKFVRNMRAMSSVDYQSLVRGARRTLSGVCDCNIPRPSRPYYWTILDGPGSFPALKLLELTFISCHLTSTVQLHRDLHV